MNFQMLAMKSAGLLTAGTALWIGSAVAAPLSSPYPSASGAPIESVTRGYAAEETEIPGLAPALESLTEHQRIAVVLINGFDWKLREVAELLSVSVSTVQTHLDRAMHALRSKLEVVEND